MIADRGYDSDPLRQRLQKRGIELIAPYRKNNQERRYEDGRKLRRYQRRWIVERTNAWLGQFRRLLVRHEHLLSTYCLLLSGLLLDYAETLFMKHALVIKDETDCTPRSNANPKPGDLGVVEDSITVIWWGKILDNFLADFL